MKSLPSRAARIGIALLCALVVGGCPKSSVGEDGFPAQIDTATAERLRRAVLVSLPETSTTDASGSMIPDLVKLRAHPGVSLALDEFAGGYPSDLSAQVAWLQYWGLKRQDVTLVQADFDAGPLVHLLLPEADAATVVTLVLAHEEEVFRFGLPDQPDPLALALLCRQEPVELTRIIARADPRLGDLLVQSADSAIAHLLATGDAPSTLGASLRVSEVRLTEAERSSLAREWTRVITVRVLDLSSVHAGEPYEDRPAFVYGQPTRPRNAEALRMLFSTLWQEAPVAAAQDPQIVNTAILWLEGLRHNLDCCGLDPVLAGADGALIARLLNELALALLPPTEAQRFRNAYAAFLIELAKHPTEEAG